MSVIRLRRSAHLADENAADTYVSHYAFAPYLIRIPS